MKYIKVVCTALALQVQIVIGQTNIGLKDYFRNLKTIEVIIENETYNFLFDTGGGVTLISPHIVDKLGKDSFGHNVEFRMSGEKLVFERCDSVSISISGLTFFHSEVAVFDIMSLLPKELNRIDGVISLKTFDKDKITLDLKNNLITVETEESFKRRTENMKEINSRFSTSLSGTGLNIFLELVARKHQWWFLFDSGNIIDIKISKAIAMSWNKTLIDNTLKYAYHYRFGGELMQTSMTIDDIIYDGALNFDFIQSHQFAISFREKRVFSTR